VVAEERCAEAAEGPAQPELASGLMACRRDDVGSEPVKSGPGLSERIG